MLSMSYKSRLLLVIGVLVNVVGMVGKLFPSPNLLFVEIRRRLHGKQNICGRKLEETNAMIKDA